MQRMKRYYDASVKPKQFEENEDVLLFDPRKKRGQFAKWQVTWKGPFVVKRRLNSRPFIVHVDRMRKYLHEQTDSSVENSEMPPSDI